MQRVQRVVVGAFLEIWGSQYDKIDLVGWWAGRYSRRGLPLRGRGAYGPVLTHGPRVASLSLRGAKAVVWRPLKMKGCHYYKTIQPPWRAMEKRPPLVSYGTTFTQREACHWILSRLTAPYSTAITDSLDSQVA